MTQATDLVTNFCAAWSKLDIDAIAGYFADDAVYHNIPVDPVEGREAIRAAVETFTTGWDRVDFEIRNILGEGPIVMTERVDHFVSAERTVSLPVMGTFEIEGDRIKAWRDYFDINQFMNQLA